MVGLWSRGPPPGWRSHAQPCKGRSPGSRPSPVHPRSHRGRWRLGEGAACPAAWGLSPRAKRSAFWGQVRGRLEGSLAGRGLRDSHLDTVLRARARARSVRLLQELLTLNPGGQCPNRGLSPNNGDAADPRDPPRLRGQGVTVNKKLQLALPATIPPLARGGGLAACRAGEPRSSPVWQPPCSGKAPSLSATAPLGTQRPPEEVTEARNPGLYLSSASFELCDLRQVISLL